MNIITITRVVAVVALGLSGLGLALKLRDIMNRPFKEDKSRARGSAGRAILYAFTLGMAPWEKESTRRHWIAYFRGILFHLGILAALALFLASPWLAALPGPVRWLALAVTAAGAAAGFAGIWLRLAEENLRALSLPDDYFSVFLTSLFVALAAAVLLWPAVLPLFYLAAAVMLVYLPFSKIRHCVYFFYAKFFFGLNFGHRGVIGQPKSKYTE
jgi:hypothetical protein